MAGDSGLRLGLRMGLLAGLGAVAISAEAAPLGLSAVALPSPDLLYCTVAHWALRAPSAAPVLLVFTLGLARDLLTDLPVGLGALVLVFAAEWLKARRGMLARQPAVVELLAVAAAAAAMVAALWLAVAVTFAEPPVMLSLVHHLAATVAVYPLVAAVLAYGLGIREARPRGPRAGDTP